MPLEIEVDRFCRFSCFGRADSGEIQLEMAQVCRFCRFWANKPGDLSFKWGNFVALLCRRRRLVDRAELVDGQQLVVYQLARQLEIRRE